MLVIEKHTNGSIYSRVVKGKLDKLGLTLQNNAGLSVVQLRRAVHEWGQTQLGLVASVANVQW